MNMCACNESIAQVQSVIRHKVTYISFVRSEEGILLNEIGVASCTIYCHIRCSRHLGLVHMLTISLMVCMNRFEFIFRFFVYKIILLMNFDFDYKLSFLLAGWPEKCE